MNTLSTKVDARILTKLIKSYRLENILNVVYRENNHVSPFQIQNYKSNSAFYSDNYKLAEAYIMGVYSMTFVNP